jgi:hypothetical protein
VTTLKERFLYIALLSAVFAVVEYIQHKEYNNKHPDQDRCGSGIIGFIVITIALVAAYF